MASQPANEEASKSAAIELLVKQLRGLIYDPNATKYFELMSGGFIWSDEKPRDYDDVAAGYAFRFLIGFRASIIGGKPREDLRFVWDAVRAACPEWPGFRPERGSRGLAEELDSANDRAMRRLCALDRLFGRDAGKDRE
jgi:hypothetical protein